MAYNDDIMKGLVQLERYKASLSKESLSISEESYKLIKGFLDEPLDEMTITEFRKSASTLEKDLAQSVISETAKLEGDISKMSSIYSLLEAESLSRVFGKKLKIPSRRSVTRAVNESVMFFSGETVGQFTESFVTDQVDQVMRPIRLGYYRGDTNNDILRAIRGTRANNYKDGILEVTRKRADAYVRTMASQYANVGRAQVWKQNSDLVEKYQWISTLDSKTTTVCRSLDLKIFAVDENVYPPAHVRCRSATRAVLPEKYAKLSEGRTRSSESGYVKDQSYYEWLKGQPDSYQRKVLGETRFQIFNADGMDATKFADLQLNKYFEPLTLNEMKREIPAIFNQIEE